MATISKQGSKMVAEQNRQFNFAKKSELIQRAKQLQVHQNQASIGQDSSIGNPKWKFVQQRDSKLEIVESSRNKLTQDESNGEFSYADEEATDFQLTSNIIYHQGESASDYIQQNLQSEPSRHKNKFLSVDGPEDGYSAETNSQYAFDQGRPDLLQRLRDMQGYQSTTSAAVAAHQPEYEESKETSDPQIILPAPRGQRQIAQTPAATIKNKLNLQIGIESPTDNGMQFSCDNLSSERPGLDQECIKISDLVHQQKHQAQTLEVELSEEDSLLPLPASRHTREQSHPHSRNPYSQMTIEVPTYTGNMVIEPLHQEEDVHPLPASVQNLRTIQHGRYMSSQGGSNRADQASQHHHRQQYNQLPQTQYQQLGPQHFPQPKSSVGQDSSTVYGTCFGSSNDKQGRHTTSFYTANSQVMLQNSNEVLAGGVQGSGPSTSVEKQRYSATDEQNYVQQVQQLVMPAEQDEADEDDQPYYYENPTGCNQPSQKQRFIQKSAKQRPESARELLSSNIKSKSSSAGKRRNHGHTSSFNGQQRSSREIDNTNMPPMLNQFSFGHLQSSDGQVCAVSETHVARENDSINQKNTQQQDVVSNSGLQHQALSLDSQLGLSNQTNTDEKLNEILALNQDLQNHGQMLSTGQTDHQENMDKHQLYQQLFNQVRSQLQRANQNQPSYQLREDQNRSVMPPQIQQKRQHSKHDPSQSVSDQKFEQFMLQKQHQQQIQMQSQLQQQQLLQQQNLQNNQNQAMRPPKPNRMRKPETFNQSMYQRSQAWLQQKELRVQLQKRESALKETQECTFEPNTQQQVVDGQPQLQQQVEGRRRSGRRGLNSTQRSKRSQIRQRDQLIHHQGRTMTTSTPQSYLNQTIQFNHKNSSLMNGGRTTSNKEHMSDGGGHRHHQQYPRQHLSTLPPGFENSSLGGGIEDSLQQEDQVDNLQKPRLNITLDQPFAPSRNRDFNQQQQHYSMVSSIVPSQFSNTMRVRSSRTPSAADFNTGKCCTTKTTERQQLQQQLANEQHRMATAALEDENSHFLQHQLHQQQHYATAVQSQDGNLLSVRAIESYRKHLERQNTRHEKKYEEQEAEQRRPGSGNLWQYKLTKPSSPKLRSLERSKLKQYAKTKTQFLRGDGLTSGRSRSASKESRGNVNPINPLNQTTKANFKAGVSANQDLSQNLRPQDTQPIDMMSVLCQSTNLQESLIKAKKGLSFDESTQRHGANSVSGSKAPFRVSQKLKNISQLRGAQEEKTYASQMMAQKQYKGKNSNSRPKTAFIRPKSKKQTSQDRSQKIANKFQKIVQGQINFGEQQYMTCQSTLSNYGKQSDLNQAMLNPHSSIQTQLLPEARNNDPLYIQMNDQNKSNTQIIDISQFNTLNENMNNASCNLDGSTPTHSNHNRKHDRSSSYPRHRPLQDRPRSQLNGDLSSQQPLNLITTGGFTVEGTLQKQPTGGCGQTEDDASYIGDMDFLNHFGAHSSIGAGDTQQQQQMVVTQSGHNNNILSINNKHYEGQISSDMPISHDHFRNGSKNHKAQLSNMNNKLNPALFESFNPQQHSHMQRVPSDANNEYDCGGMYNQEALLNPHLQVIEEYRRSSTSNMPNGGGAADTSAGLYSIEAAQAVLHQSKQLAITQQNSDSLVAQSEADSTNIKDFIRNQIYSL